MTVSPPVVSVVITVHDGERYVAQAIESVLAQTVSDIEILVVDDGSSDYSRELIGSYARIDPRVRLISQPRSGVAEARNVGIEEARAQWVALLDHDDLFEPDKLRRQLDHASRHPYAAVISTFGWRIGSKGRELGTFDVGPVGVEAFEQRRAQNKVFYLIASSVMLKRDVALRVGGFRGMAVGIEDVDMWSRLSDDHTILTLPERLVRYRVHAESFSAQVLALQRISKNWLQENIVRRRSGQPELTVNSYMEAYRSGPMLGRVVNSLSIHSHARYRAAGALLADRNPLGLVSLLASFLLWPPLPAQRLKSQVWPWLTLKFAGRAPWRIDRGGRAVTPEALSDTRPDSVRVGGVKD